MSAAPARALPRGTVTLLFTDIEGSTRLLHELGDEYVDVLAEHRRILRDAFSRYGGVEVDTQGDSFFYAFERAHDGAAAAANAQEALAGGRVRVRMGLHVGEPRVTDEGYVGEDVHRAARIMGAAHGGQVLLSQTTRDLVADGFDLRDLGEHVLKDVGAVRLYQLGDRGFPPVRSLGNTNLPAQLEPVLGRKRELADLLRLMRVDGARLVTITGPGGIGKTRLTLEVAAELTADFDDGVWLIDLSPLRDAALVVPTIATVLGAKDTLERHVGSKELLLVLDNFEQVIDAAVAVSDLLAACANLRLVVTSREPLRIAGEREYVLRPLAEAPSVELFRQRAAVDSEYEAVAEVCRRVDHLPLAIELAAARSKTLSPTALLERLDRRLPLLTRGRRDAPARQQTLRATIEWSYELCSPDEQRVFRRLGAFAGGRTAEAAERVCDATLDDLEALVDKNLLRHDGARYAMLETIWELATELLDTSDERDDIRKRHAEWMLDLANSANVTVENDAGEMHHEWITAELDNVRNALEWCLASGEHELGLRICFALENWWVAAGPAREGTRWTSELLAAAGDVPHELRAQALRVLGNNAAIVGDVDAGLRHYEASLQQYRELGDERGIAIMLVRVAYWALQFGEEERGRRLVAELEALLPRVGLPRLRPQALQLQADLAYADGAIEAALELAEQSASAAEALQFTWWHAGALETIAEWLFELGRVDEAERRDREALALALRMHDRQRVVFALARFAAYAAHSGHDEAAGRLWGAVEAEEARGPIGQWEGQRDQYAGRLASNDAFEAGRAEGRRLSLDEAALEALGRA